jgi:hypothetical protein
VSYESRTLKMKSHEKPVLLVVCGRSCGAIDWILPVLRAVERSGRADVKVFFRMEATYRRLQSEFRDLSSVLETSEAEVLTKRRVLEDLSIGRRMGVLIRSTFRALELGRPRRALKSALQLLRQLSRAPFSRTVRRADKLDDGLTAGLLVDRLRTRDVAYVLHDMPADVPTYSRGFDEAEIIYFQHGTLTFERLEDDTRHIQHMRTQEPLDDIPERTIWLIGSPGEETYYRRIGVRCRVFSSGHPKFDPHWAAVLKNHSAPMDSQNPDGRGKPKVLFLSMPDWKFTDSTHRRKLIEQLFRVSVKHDWDLRVRLHPDENREGFRAIATAANCDRLQWCETSVTGGAAQADFVVCFPTSAAMDAVAAGAPVVEFFDFGEEMHTSYINEHGNKTSIYRTEGLVEAASSESELDEIARRSVEEDGYLEKVRAGQHARLAAIFVEHDHATDRILKLLDGLSHAGRTRSGA